MKVDEKVEERKNQAEEKGNEEEQIERRKLIDTKDK